MNCEKIKEKLIDLLNNELSEKDNKIIAQHLKECTKCQKELAELKSLYNLVEQFKPVVKYPYPSDDFLSQVRRRIRTRYSTLPKPNILPRLIPIFASLAVVLIIVVGFTLHKNLTNKKYLGQRYFYSLSTENTSATYVYDNLDTETQILVTDQIINDTVIENLNTLDLAIISDIDTDALISMLTDNEKEMLVQEILERYDYTQ